MIWSKIGCPLVDPQTLYSRKLSQLNPQPWSPCNHVCKIIFVYFCLWRKFIYICLCLWSWYECFMPSNKEPFIFNFLIFYFSTLILFVENFYHLYLFLSHSAYYSCGRRAVLLCYFWFQFINVLSSEAKTSPSSLAN